MNHPVHAPSVVGGPIWSNSQMIHLAKLDKPYLVMGYDWERCGREGDPPHKIQSDRQLAQKGLKIVSQTHQEYDAPFTLFVLGKMLEIPELCASLLEELESHHLRSIIDVQGHAYSHRPFKKSPYRSNALGSDEIRHELAATSSLAKEKLGYEITGLRTPLGYYWGTWISPWKTTWPILLCAIPGPWPRMTTGVLSSGGCSTTQLRRAFKW